MKLMSLKFCRYAGEPQEWCIEGKPQQGQTNQWLTFNDINLVVGKNASGKSKTLDVIRHIADLCSGDVSLAGLHSLGYGTANYQLKFDDDGRCLEYSLSFKNGEITQELLILAGSEKLNREKGMLWYESAKETLEFQTDNDVLAISKRDKKQHSFFEKLYRWGKNLRHYHFGALLGKNHILKNINNIGSEPNFKDDDRVSKVFLMAKEEFQDVFTDLILKDMNALAYGLKSVDLTLLKNLPMQGYGLTVQESELGDMTYQLEMSQGMFRALSLLIQLNYALLSKNSNCILIDDIGEGLDFERAKGLIDLVIEKVKNSSIQIIMTTNDRFVMNKVPLEYWSVIQRVANKSIFYNQQNSPETFEAYPYSGLSNFDFLTTEFYIHGFETE